MQGRLSAKSCRPAPDHIPVHIAADEAGVHFALLGGKALGQANGAWTRHADESDAGRARIARREFEARLPAADQLQIDLGQQFRIDPRAMFGAPGKVDAEAAAEL